MGFQNLMTSTIFCEDGFSSIFCCTESCWIMYNLYNIKILNIISLEIIMYNMYHRLIPMLRNPSPFFKAVHKYVPFESTIDTARRHFTSKTAKRGMYFSALILTLLL